jgi:hypothetical protein
VLQAAVDAQCRRADRAEADAERQAERAARAEEQHDRVLADLQSEREQRAAEAAQFQAALDAVSADMRAERSRAERAEAFRDGERARADALRDRLEMVQTEAAEAKQHAREAEEAIAALRRGEEDRKARGRWARLRAAWRGE